MFIKHLNVKPYYSYFFSWFIFFLSSCFASNGPTNESVNLDDNFLRTNGTVNPIIKGYWKSVGNGYILDATSDSILLYSYTKSFCYKEKNDYIEGLLNDKARFRLDHDTLSIYRADFGEKSSALQIKQDYVRVDGLPTNTISFLEMQKLGAKNLFKLFIESYQENYAFSRERNIDWGAVQAKFESKVSDSASEKELFELFGQIVTDTKDHHSKIIHESGQSMQYRVTPSAEIVAQVFRSQTLIKKLDDYFGLFFNTNYTNISDSLLHGKGSKTANGKLEWGSLTNDIGYLSIFSFDGFLPKGFTRRQQMDSLNYYMEHIINELKDKNAIIIDISFNFGGFDAASLTVASYFTDKLKPAYISQVFNNGTFYNEDTVYIRPADKIVFNKPVYILMSDISRSQAEGFAMTMKANSNVKLVGTNTLGILSSMLGKSIGTFYSTISNQRLILPGGRYYEVSGVEPDIPMTIFTTQDIFGGHKDAVRKIVEMIATR